MTGLLFWTISGAIALGVALLLIVALRRPAHVTASRETFDGQVYRDQLREIERDAARGMVGPGEAERLRAEVGRRLLATERGGDTPVAARSGSALGAAVICALAIAAGFGIYAVLGQPGRPDLPLQTRISLAEEFRASRPDQAALEAELPPSPPLQAADPSFLELMDKLRAAMQTRPDDLTGQRLLARNEATLGNFAAAHKAQAKVIDLLAGQASAQDHVLLATLMIQSAQGRVSPEAEDALWQALQMDANNDSAMFFLGILNIQIGREDLSFRLWRKLIEVAPADSPWLPEVRARMPELARIAGVKYRLPDAPGLAGPSAEEIEAAGAMSTPEQQEMIRGMVDRLAERLATEGGSPEEWGRLITSLVTLGEKDRAQAIWDEAKEMFKGRPEAFTTVRDAAVTAGLAL